MGNLHAFFTLNFEGDKNPSSWKDGVVTTTPGFKEAYDTFCRDGWASMTAPVAYGGQGLPESAQLPFAEMLCSANLAWTALRSESKRTFINVQPVIEMSR